MKDNNTTPAMKKKLTSAEYHALPMQLKNRYTRFSGSDEVYYELIGIAPAMKEVDKSKFDKDFEKFLSHPWKDLYQDVLLLKAMREAAEWALNWREENPVKPVAKEGKSAQSILSATGKTISTITHIELLRCMQEYAEAYHAAQLTEVKGEGKLLTDYRQLLMSLIALNHVPDEVCPDINDMISRIDDALAAPSTHSSSEMVEVEWITNDYPQHERVVLIKDAFGAKHIAYCTTRMIVDDDLEIFWKGHEIGELSTNEVYGWMELPE